MHALVAAFAGHVVDVGVEIEVLHHRQVGVETESLAHVADLGLDRFGLADDIVTGNRCLARIGVHDRGQQPHGRRLARAVGTNETEDFTFFDLQGKTVKSGNAVKLFCKTLSDDHRFALYFVFRYSDFSLASAGIPGFNSLSGLST